MSNTPPDGQHRATATSDELDFPLDPADDLRTPSNDTFDIVYHDAPTRRHSPDWDLSADAMRAAAASQWRRRVYLLSLVGVLLAGAMFAIPLLQRGNLSSMFDWSGSAPAPDGGTPVASVPPAQAPPPPAEAPLPPVIAETPPAAQSPVTEPEHAAPSVPIPQTPIEAKKAPPAVERDQAPPSSTKPPPRDASTSSRRVETTKPSARIEVPAPTKPPQSQRASTPVAPAPTTTVAPAQTRTAPPARTTSPPSAQTTPSAPAPAAAAAPPPQAAPPQTAPVPPAPTASATPAQTNAPAATASTDANRDGASAANRVGLPSDVNRVRLPSDVNKVIALPSQRGADAAAPSSGSVARTPAAPAASSAPAASTPSPVAPPPPPAAPPPSPAAAPSTPAVSPTPAPAATTTAPPRPAPTPAVPPTTPPSNAAAPASASSTAAASRPAAPLVDRSRETDARAIDGTLARYRNAFNTLNAGAAAEVWPSVDKRTLTRAFEQLKEQRVAFDGCQTNIKETRAEAVCTGLTRYVPRIGGRLQVDRRQWTFNLMKVRDEWVIQSVEAK